MGLHPPQGDNLIVYPVHAAVAKRPGDPIQDHETKRAQAVVKGHDDDIFGRRKVACVEPGLAARADAETTSMDPDHDGAASLEVKRSIPRAGQRARRVKTLRKRHDSLGGGASG